MKRINLTQRQLRLIESNAYTYEETPITIQNMFEYNNGDFYWEMFNRDVQIGKNEVIVGYFDEEKHGMSYSEYEDPDGWELDSFILPTNIAWNLFLKECFEEYVSCVEGWDCDMRDTEISNIVGNFKEEVKYMRPYEQKEYGIVYKEGSPFGYEGE